MSDPKNLMARAIWELDHPGQLWEASAENYRLSGTFRKIEAALTALDAAGYQIIEKPLTLTSEMAALCEQEAPTSSRPAAFRGCAMAEKHGDATINAYMRRYGERIYDPTANAEAIAAKNAAVARRARLAGMLSAPKVNDAPCA